MTPLRVVLDTNSVISALVFSSGHLSWLRTAWQAGHFIPLVCPDTVSELIRVLRYPKFKLSWAEQEALLAEFLPFAETVVSRGKLRGLPKLRDPCDIMFFALALRAKADLIISGDEDILSLRSTFKRIPVKSPNEFRQMIQPASL